MGNRGREKKHVASRRANVYRSLHRQQFIAQQIWTRISTKHLCPTNVPTYRGYVVQEHLREEGHGFMAAVNLVLRSRGKAFVRQLENLHKPRSGVRTGPQGEQVQANACRTSQHLVSPCLPPCAAPGPCVSFATIKPMEYWLAWQQHHVRRSCLGTLGPAIFLDSEPPVEGVCETLAFYALRRTA